MQVKKFAELLRINIEVESVGVFVTNNICHAIVGFKIIDSSPVE